MSKDKIDSKNKSGVLHTSDKVRDALHKSTIAKTKIYKERSKGFWDQLWACLDTINHTEIAIVEFINLKPEIFDKAPNNLTYGLLQNLYVQQDALSNLSEAIFDKKINIWSDKQPALFYVRGIRNVTIGHPTKKEGGGVNKYCVIDQSSLNKEGFTYWLWSAEKFQKESIKFDDLINKQRIAILEELGNILIQIKKQESKHKKSFKGKPLSPLIPDKEPYSLSLLRKIAYDQLGWIVLKDYEDKYETIKTGLAERYGELNQTLRIPGTKMLLEELDRIFQRVKELNNSGSDMEIDLNIYADALVDRLKKLKTHLDEIDGEFMSK
jgi:hypothetical protein